jgi:hypothetical protein
MLRLRCLFWIGEIIVVMLVIIPIARFLLYQWSLRELEFVNRFSQGSLDVYLARFYARTEATKALSDIQLFEWSYRRLVGRHLYYIPTAMLTVIVALLGGLVIMTAIRAGYENYVDFYAKNTAVAQSFSHLSLGALDDVVFPFPDIVLSAQALAAIAGAYLYVVGVVIQGFRTKTLTSSDILWCCFRMVIAVPMAVSLSGLANSSLGPFIAFALGAFPIEAISRLLRRLMTKTLGEADEPNSDQAGALGGGKPANLRRVSRGGHRGDPAARRRRPCCAVGAYRIAVRLHPGSRRSGAGLALSWPCDRGAGQARSRQRFVDLSAG